MAKCGLLFISVISVLMDSATGTPSKPPQKKLRADEIAVDAGMDGIVVETTEGMPPWAIVMQEALMTHTTKQMKGLRSEVEDVKSMAVESQEQIKALQEEVGKLKASQSENPKVLRNLKDLEADFQRFQIASGGKGGGKAQSVRKGSTVIADAEKRNRTVTFGQFWSTPNLKR